MPTHHLKPTHSDFELPEGECARRRLRRPDPLSRFCPEGLLSIVAGSCGRKRFCFTKPARFSRLPVGWWPAPVEGRALPGCQLALKIKHLDSDLLGRVETLDEAELGHKVVSGAAGSNLSAARRRLSTRLGQNRSLFESQTSRSKHAKCRDGPFLRRCFWTTTE